MPKQRTPQAMDVEVRMLPGIKKIWWKIKKTKLFLWFRHSRLNPYHWGLKDIQAASYEEAREKAYAMGEVQFLYNGTRYYSERHDCSVDEEYKSYKKVLRGRGNVADRIPRDKNGNLDLLAEDPIVITIIPIEGPSLIGHACMQYKDRVVNRLLPSVHTDALYPKYESFAEYYYVYPSKVGINPKKLLREMDKHNIKYGYKRYDPFTNNCSQNVVQILEKLGIKDIDLYGPDKLGIRYATPGNNPFGVGLKDWCFRHGVHVHLDEMKKLYERYPVSDVKEKRQKQEEIRERYKKVTGRKDIVTKKELQAKKKNKYER